MTAVRIGIYLVDCQQINEQVDGYDIKINPSTGACGLKEWNVIVSR